jgi:DNA-directed RNA polymerase subunit RPC12/RpoP
MQNQISQLAEKMEYIAKISEDLGNIMDKPDTREGSPAGRLQCPKCSSLKVREVEDKDNVVSFIPKPIYGTKYICTDCKNEWR